MERFDTSKCRGKLEKMGVLCTHSSKSPGPFPKLLIIKIEKNKEFSIKRVGQPCPSVDRLPAAGRCLDRVGLPIFFGNSFFSCPPLFAQVVNSCWLVPAQARLPRVYLKTSNTHNFCTIALKIMKFVLTRSLF
jgi:hypothetical protein